MDVESRPSGWIKLYPSGCSVNDRPILFLVQTGFIPVQNFHRDIKDLFLCKVEFDKRETAKGANEPMNVLFQFERDVVKSPCQFIDSTFHKSPIRDEDFGLALFDIVPIEIANPLPHSYSFLLMVKSLNPLDICKGALGFNRSRRAFLPRNSFFEKRQLREIFITNQ